MINRIEEGKQFAGTLTVPNTGAWQAWQTMRIDGIALSAGRHAVRLVFIAAGTNGIVNMNFLRFVQ